MVRSLPGGVIRGRGASTDPPNRFTARSVVRDASLAPSDEGDGDTRLLADTSRTVIARNDSPDVGFDVSLNPYRGCEHGCVYCYARPTHEYLGFSAGLDFETRILFKPSAPALLREALASPRWTPQPLLLSGVTDPYQPAERRLRITRRCLEVLAEFRNPVSVVTKSHLVVRDVDVLAELAACGAAAVTLSVTTLSPSLHRVLEPRAPTPRNRLRAIETLSGAGIPVGVFVAPVIPAITDHEMPRILQEASNAGATSAGYIMLRLPGAVAPLFRRWLHLHFPDREAKVLARIRDLRGGRLNDSRFGTRGRGEGPYSLQASQLFEVACRRAGLSTRAPALSAQAFRQPPASAWAEQGELFG